MFDLITIGDALVDIFFVLDEQTSHCHIDPEKKRICFDYAEKMSINQSTHDVGGNAANVAVGARKLGLKTSILTEIGDDINGQVILEALKKKNVDLSLVHIHKEQETRYSVVLNYGSERTILSYHAKPLGASFETLQKQLVTYLKAHPDVQLAMNPGSYQFAHGLESIQHILPRVAVLMVNKEEAAKLAGSTNRTSIQTLLMSLHAKGPKTIVITDGVQGAYGSQAGSVLHMPPYPIEAKAKTGAGDAFTSGFLAALMQKKSLEEAMQWGTANAGGVIQKFGAQEGLLNKKGIQTIIDTYPDILPRNITKKR
ncbi:MAG: hypothetical protein UV42_C0005G0011 [Candidatus Magasanikbacteria bacterium GW2011_GWE2_42_7]|uniref:Carbohydrate kinase PfkB domain-containing protein n=1 Tax=Candidatus Magasanikbacteria bacterium GW2011_GWE2_42_7 TaxID=1619052 RepID=A0A0G1BHN1_9BACT|nr:MAG: hypothetical protein UV42_C0005G0011 [Candidatus Magasanikbacteria bacterium GW2011_GWE2_42_7]